LAIDAAKPSRNRWPARSQACVANSAGDDITVIDTVTNGVTGNIKVANVEFLEDFATWMGRRSLLLRINVLFAILVSWNLLALLARVVDLS
jgi:YVTN family beta-propeller protein